MGFDKIEIDLVLSSIVQRLEVMEGGMGGLNGLMAQYQRAAA